MVPEHTNVPAPDHCHMVNDVLARIGDKWSMLIVMSLGEKTFRFNELKRRTNRISQRMLTLTLRGLERDGLVDRDFKSTIPPTVSYQLTELGQSLREAVSVLGQWAIEHHSTVKQARTRYDARSAPDQ